MSILRHAALAASFLVATGAVAQTLPVEDFARQPEISETAMSPTGEFIALTSLTADGKETQLRIVRLDGTSSSPPLRFGKDEHITDLIWTDDRRLVVSRARKVFGEERPRSTGQLFGVDADGKNQEMLFGYVPDVNGTRGRRKDNGFAAVERVLPGKPGFVMVSYYSYEQGDEPDYVVYLLDTNTGERKEVERVKRALDMTFDGSGKLRVLATLDQNDVPQMFYRPTADSALVPMPKSLVGFRTYSGWFEADGNTAYMGISDDGEPLQIYKLDLAKGTRQKVAGREDQDAVNVQIGGISGAPFGVVYDAGRPAVAYIDPNSEWAVLHASLLKRFPGQLVDFIDFTRDNQTVLFNVYSDRNPGATYQYNRKTNVINLVVEYQPWIKPERMAQQQPVEFLAKDGTKIYGFYTANGTGPKPLIVMPHGGPMGPYDRWGYDTDAQFLASRGYAVLQVNYRGSGGRGYNFEKAGWRQWGNLIQQDIADGARWAIAQGKADPARVCIYGASFGGFSALMNPVRNPDLYKCAVGYAGVYDLNLWLETGWQWKSKGSRRVFDRENGDNSADRSEQSPRSHAAEIKIPVFLVHGKDDERVRVDHFQAMEAALIAAGHKPQTMLVDREGHGFYKPENVIDLYRRLEAFLGQNIGSGAAPGAAGSH